MSTAEEFLWINSQLSVRMPHAGSVPEQKDMAAVGNVEGYREDPPMTLVIIRFSDLVITVTTSGGFIWTNQGEI